MHCSNNDMMNINLRMAFIAYSLSAPYKEAALWPDHSCMVKNGLPLVPEGGEVISGAALFSIDLYVLLPLTPFTSV